MLLIIALIAASALIFSQELTRVIQKIIVFRGVALLVPMILASCLIEVYEDQIYLILLNGHDLFYNVQKTIAAMLPFETASLYLIRIVTLCFLSGFPFCIFWFESMRKGSHKLPAIAYYISAVLWSIAALVLVLQPI